MKRTDTIYPQAAVQILRRSHFGAVATVAPDGSPWNSPLVIEKDNDLNLYWYSDKTSRHAQNVRHDGRVMIVFYDSNTLEANARLGGLYIEAIAHECTDPEEVRRACLLRKSDADYPKRFMGRASRRVYKAVPQRVWVNDYLIRNGKFVRDYRIELPVGRLRSLSHSAARSRPIAYNKKHENREGNICSRVLLGSAVLLRPSARCG